MSIIDMNVTLKTIVIIILCSSALWAQTNDVDYISEIMVIPTDTAAAQDLRIWVPIEKGQRTEIKIDIFDSKHRLVRQFFDWKLPMGYHNFYWDKINDSGNFVSEGQYQYRITYPYGQSLRTDILKVYYKDGERDFQFKLISDVNAPGVSIKCLNDSSILTLEILDKREKQLKAFFKDSIFTLGEHSFLIKPEDSLMRGQFFFKMTSKDFIYKREFQNKTKRLR